MTSLLLGVVIACLAGSSVTAGSMLLRIEFIDNPPYETSWLPWKQDHFKMVFTLRNCTDSTYAIHKSTPCNDCYPVLRIQSASDDREPKRTRELDVLYILSDQLYIDLVPNQVYSDTIDWAEYITYDLVRGEEYIIWLEFDDYYVDYQFEDSTRTTPIWPRSIISDTLRFTF